MKKPATIYYLAATSLGRWGNGESLREAFENAAAIGKRGKRRTDIDVVAYLNIQFPEDAVTEEEAEKRPGAKPGEFRKPYVDDWGSTYYRGTLVPLDLGV